MLRDRRSSAIPGLNLLPVMNLVTILIPLLLMAAQMVHLAVIDSTLPAISPITAPAPPSEALLLRLLITGEGMALKGSQGLEVEGLPCAETKCAGVSSYDFEGLSAQLADIKVQHPTADSLVLVPTERVPYEVLIAAMDAAREDASHNLLFPYVTISGGAG